MQDRLISRRDFAFVLYELLDTESLCARARFADHSRETFDAALDTAQRIAAEHFAPHNRKADLNEPTFDGKQVHIIPEVKRALRGVLRRRPAGRRARTTTWAACSCR